MFSEVSSGAHSVFFRDLSVLALKFTPAYLVRGRSSVFIIRTTPYKDYSGASGILTLFSALRGVAPIRLN